MNISDIDHQNDLPTEKNQSYNSRNSQNHFFMIELFFSLKKSIKMSDYGIKIGHGVHSSA